MFNQQLFQAKNQLQQQQTLPFHIHKRKNLSEFGLTLVPNKQFLEFDADELFGEFSHQSKHYHYMKLTDGVLLMDVTERVIVKRSTLDILLVLALVFLPCLLVAFFIARAISIYALKPFHRLSQHFQNKTGSQSNQITQTIDIEEADVRIIAEQLEQALDKQQQLIEEQIAFNQGMSHEIRTPLQVMSHSIELIEVNHAELYQQPSVQRLVKSLARAKRISNALLWLTSKDEYQENNCLNSVLKAVLVESKNLANVHQLNITLDNINDCQPKVLMPEDVLELIFFNLINNVIHHGKQQDGTICLSINITENEITFSNEQASDMADQQHFSLGLKLIEKLTERFQLDFNTTIIDQQFNATLSYS